MKKVTMKDFRWLGKPQIWQKTYKDLTLTVEGKLCLPDGPLLLAVSDEDFILSLDITTPPQGGFCGLCLYHTEHSYISVGRSRTDLLIESSSLHSRTTSTIALPTDQESIQWHLERTGTQVRIGCADGSEGQVQWVCSTTMAGMQDSISFGPFFSNYTSVPFEAMMHGMRYAKRAEQTLVQPPLI
ncbi:MAG: hypothetical protein RBR15_08565 [Sphaerochaeta sp.]|nr:hypothetical protein [Sphaerochaeta sp.]